MVTLKSKRLNDQRSRFGQYSHVAIYDIQKEAIDKPPMANKKKRILILLVIKNYFYEKSLF